MVHSVSENKSTNGALELLNPPSAGKSPGQPFSSALTIQQADGVLRNTNQYPKWRTICQKNDSSLPKLAEQILARDRLDQQHAAGENISWSQFDKLTHRIRQSGIILPDSSKLGIRTGNISPLGTSSQPATPLPSNETSPVSESIISEDNLLIVNLKVPVLNQEKTIICYGDEKQTMIPLSAIAEILNFPIEIDQDRQVAKGWFLSEDNTIEIDGRQNTVTNTAGKHDISNGQIRAYEGDIFLDRRFLSTILPVDLSFSYGELSLTLEPREKLPVQEQYERELRRIRLSEAEDMDLRTPLNKEQYDLLSFPVFDLSMSGGTDTFSGDDSEFKGNYSLIMEGDVGKMGANVNLSGHENSWLNTAHIKVNRLDYKSELLGPLKASKIAAGDVNPLDLPILPRPNTERGVYLSNEDLFRSNDYDTTSFEGNVPPGWDAELYRNGTLIQSLRAGNDGRYLFSDIPVFFGKNSFEVRTYGPQGQRRLADEKIINVGTEMIPEGDFEYSLSATEKKTTVLGVDERNSSTDEGGMRFTGNMKYGLDDNLFMSSGLTSLMIDNTRHNYLQAGLGGSVDSFYGQTDLIYDTAGGHGLSLQGQTSVGPLNIKGKQEFFSDFIMEDNPNNPAVSKSLLAVNGYSLPSDSLPPFSYTLSSEYDVFENSESGNVSARLGTHLFSLNLANTLSWDYHSTGDRNTSTLRGDFQVSGGAGPGRITGGINYTLGSENDIDQFRIGGSWPITADLSTAVNLTQYTDNEEKTIGSASLDWDSGNYILSPSVSYDSEVGIGAMLTLSFSLGQDPISKDFLMSSHKRSGRGAASVLVYHDENSNHVYDNEDTPLPEVELVARQARSNSYTNEKGIAHFTNLTQFKPTDIEINKDTLEDPFWEPSIPGEAVIPRSGSIKTITIPVVTTGEIDGTLYTRDSEGQQKQLSNVVLEILNEQREVVESTTSEYDGFYLFEKVFPGNYTLRISPSDSRFGTHSQITEKEVTIGTDGTIASGNDIILDLSPKKDKSRSFDNTTPIQQHKTSFPPKDATSPGHTATLITSNQPAAGTDILQKKETPVANFTAQQIADQSRPKSPTRIAPPVLDPKSTITIHPLVTETGRSRPPNDAPSPSKDNYTVHLASYRSRQNALAGIQVLSKRLEGIIDPEELTVHKVDLGIDKGSWYRVVYGNFSEKGDLSPVLAELEQKTDYTRILKSSPEDRSGYEFVARSSYPKPENIPAASLSEIQKQAPEVAKKSDTSQPTNQDSGKISLTANVNNGQTQTPAPSSLQVPETSNRKTRPSGSIAQPPKKPERLIAFSRPVARFSPIGNIITPIAPEDLKNIPAPENAIAPNIRRHRLASKPVPADKQNVTPSTENSLFANPVFLDGFFCVHLASYGSLTGARTGLASFKKQLRSIANKAGISIVKMDLGKNLPQKYRVICGKFQAKESAVNLAAQIRKSITSSQSSRPLPAETPNEIPDPVQKMPNHLRSLAMRQYKTIQERI